MTGHEAVLGDYVLLEEVGRGAHSVVHRGRRRDRAGRVVAVKRLSGPADATTLARLRREADTLASLAHPAVVPLLDVVDDTAGGPALVLPWAPGGSLEDVLQRDGRLPWPRVADLGARLASALASAHGAGILHRDVKPANVLLGAEDEPRLADFGVARLRGDGADAVVGTAEYLDPAVAVDGDEPSPRSDTYSLGVVLYRALTGQLPYAGGSPNATVAAAARGVHPPLADLVDDAPVELVDAIERAMARDPGDRFGAAQQLQVALEPLVRAHEARRWEDLAGQLSGGPGPATDVAPPPPPEPVTAPGLAPRAPVGDSGTRLFGPRPPATSTPRTTARRPRWWAIVGVSLVVLVPIVVLGVLLRGGGDADPAPSPSATPTPLDALTPRSEPTPCDDAVAPDGGGRVLLADVDGTGCGRMLAVTEQAVDGRPTQVLVVPGDAGDAAGRYALGDPADGVVVGDWDCDGTETPAVVRATDGQAFLYDGYGALDPTPGPSLAPGASVHVVTDADGCDQLTSSEG